MEASACQLIARGDGHRVDTFVIQHAPQVLLEGRLLAVSCSNCAPRFCN
jgi:hypothetical protein